MSSVTINTLFFTGGILFAILSNMVIERITVKLENLAKKQEADKIKKSFTYLHISDTMH